MNGLLTAAVAALILAGSAAGQDAGLGSSLCVATEVSTKEDFEAFAPAICGSLEYDFGTFVAGASTLFNVADKEHRVTTVEIGVDAGPVRAFGFLGYGEEDPKKEDEDAGDGWGRFGAGLAFTLAGLALEARIREDVLSTHTFELRLRVN